MISDYGISEASPVKGRVSYVLRDSTGNVKLEFTRKNVVTILGKAQMSARLIGTSVAAVSHIAIGSAATSFTKNSTTLGTETHRESATTSQVTTTDSNDTAQAVATVSFTGTEVVQESGLFNNSSGGTMTCAQSMSAINVNNGDSLQITWKVAFA